MNLGSGPHGGICATSVLLTPSAVPPSPPASSGVWLCTGPSARRSANLPYSSWLDGPAAIAWKTANGSYSSSAWSDISVLLTSASWLGTCVYQVHEISEGSARPPRWRSFRVVVARARPRGRLSLRSQCTMMRVVILVLAEGAPGRGRRRAETVQQP